jgi:hypothetical protein
MHLPWKQAGARSLCAYAVTAVMSLSCCFGDVVVLDNGDRITGELQKLDSGKLELKTSYAGTIDLTWERVAEITTDTHFDVEAESGRRWRGKLQPGTGELEVVDEDVSNAVPLLAVKSIAAVPEDPGWLAPLSGTFDVGLSLARGNSRLNQSSARMDANYRTGTYQVQVELSSLFADQIDTQSTSRHYGAIQYDRYFSPQGFTFLLANFERDERRSLNLRSTYGGGLGWKLVESRDHEVSLLGGFTLVSEQFRADPAAGMRPPSGSGEGLFGLNLRNNIANGAEFVNKFLVTPNLLNPGRYRLSLESEVRMPLFGRYTWSLQLYNRFDSEPPVQAKRNDYGAISSLGVTF